MSLTTPAASKRSPCPDIANMRLPYGCVYSPTRRHKILIGILILLLVTFFYLPSPGSHQGRERAEEGINILELLEGEAEDVSPPQQEARKSNELVNRNSIQFVDRLGLEKVPEKAVDKVSPPPQEISHSGKRVHGNSILFVERVKVEPVSTTMADNMAANETSVFESAKVYKLITACRTETDTIFIDCYINAYEQLCQLFRLFGKIFGFVTSDVEDKIGILRKYYLEQPEHYKTVQSMLEYEVSQGLTDSKKRPSGSRTLLRLHRAMEFISAFLVKLRDSENSAKFSTCTGEAYDSTLAKHHPWLIKKAVHVALYMLPTRQELLRQMAIEDSEEGLQAMSNLITELNIIFGIIEKLYAKDDLLDLP